MFSILVLKRPFLPHFIFFFVVTIVFWYILKSDPYIPSQLEDDDYSQLIDLKSFKFLKIPFPCSESTSLLILIHSHPKNSFKRQIIRETWGRSSDYAKILFVIGAGGMKNITRENEEFGDLLQGSFVDSYKNLTYKHVAALKYAVYHCPQPGYVLKTDDDVFVNIPQLKNFLHKNITKLIFCRLARVLRPVRGRGRKWFVTREEYQADFYPEYCLGPYVLYSRDVVSALYQQAQRTKYFWIDDVFVTGIVAEKIGVPRVSAARYMLRDLRMILENKTQDDFLFGSFQMKSHDIKALYNRMLWISN